MKLPNFPADYRPLEIFRPDRATSDSVPRAVARLSKGAYWGRLARYRPRYWKRDLFCLLYQAGM